MSYRINIPLYRHIDSETAAELAREITETMALSLAAEVEETPTDTEGTSDDFAEMFQPMGREEIHEVAGARCAYIIALLTSELLPGDTPVNRHAAMEGMYEGVLEDATAQVPGFGEWLRNRLAPPSRRIEEKSRGILRDLRETLSDGS